MSDEDILNARLASQVLANLGEMAVSRALSEQASNLRQQLRSSQSSAGTSTSTSASNWNNQADKIRQANLTFKNRKLEKENKLLRQENDYYRSLLTKPMEEIANQNESFRATYTAHSEGVAGWMISQKVFKEIADKATMQSKKSSQEFKREYLEALGKVLNGHSEHGNNASALPWLIPRIQAVKNTFKIA